MSAATITAPDKAPDQQRGPTGGASDDVRIGLRGNLRHIGALARRNVMQIKQDPGSMVDAMLMPIIFTLLFVYVFGGAVGGSLGGNGDVYTNYVIPGLLAMGGLNIAMSVGTGINDDFSMGVMDRFRTMPIARSSVLVAKLIVEGGRMLVSSTILLLVAFIIGFDLKKGPLELLAAAGLALAFGTSLTWIFMLLGLSMKTPQAVQGIGFLILMPLAVRVLGVRPDRDDAGLVAGVHRLQPAVQPRGRGPRPVQRRGRGGRPGVGHAGLVGGDHRGDRPAGGAQVPHEDLSRGRAGQSPDRRPRG